MAPGEAFVEAFHDACFDGDLLKTQEALDNGQLSAEDLSEGLNLATAEAHADIVTALFDAGARMTADSPSFLIGDNGRQHPSIVRYYLDHGLDPNCSVSNGEPLLRFMKDTKCAEELLSRGADPNRCGPKGVSPLACALGSISEEDTALFEALLSNGARLESTLFFHAIRPGESRGEFKTKLLLSKGLDPNTSSPEWGTPLHRAVYLARRSIVKVLLDAGADKTARSDCRQFHNQSPAEVAEWTIQRYPNSPELCSSLENILELLQSHER
ncbi:ankyrin repeat domain-containing protein [Aspergillus luchuensis]|uniref:Uncharacterized protein n=1 Tax=Aspergillus kawachii TaxID=1069201 RepID=A0A146F751_ASPKA|nr:uncharacterized protein AKAW2_81405A [Aspergillus luchuensis]BCS05604.1 hypothetical protein AKAW2_81405A [Aspergillus luchuensis]BCS17157.1 hypothetical protein ALUC_81364A [Aspergillus luchuensis]GAA93106.1 hypothetical protein AKAW_11218 [Aspergillus luchuensis IFO 4308]GAT21897.1 hypothetical protein RIB2604_01300010 [Aspergillus luchuensis]